MKQMWFTFYQTNCSNVISVFIWDQKDRPSAKNYLKSDKYVHLNLCSIRFTKLQTSVVFQSRETFYFLVVIHFSVSKFSRNNFISRLTWYYQSFVCFINLRQIHQEMVLVLHVVPLGWSESVRSAWTLDCISDRCIKRSPQRHPRGLEIKNNLICLLYGWL